MENRDDGAEPDEVAAPADAAPSEGQAAGTDEDVEADLLS